jgi:hypothetical protein
MSTRTLITCTRCSWTQLVTPVSPPDPTADLAAGIRRRARLGQCPRCGDVNLDVEQRDLFGRVETRSI